MGELEGAWTELLSVLHWLTLYDESDGEPYGQTCSCEIGAAHNGNGELTDPD